MYSRLFDISVQHPAYPNGRCMDARIVSHPTHASGERALARHRMLARVRPGGIEVAVRVDQDATGIRPALAWPDSLVLGFEMTVAGPDFASLTNLNAHGQGMVPIYRNGVGAAGPAQFGLHGEVERPAPGVVLLVEVSGLRPAWLAAPPQFGLALAVRQLPWVYYVLTRRMHSDTPRIEAGTGGSSPSFSCKQLTSGNTPLRADPMGRALMRQFAPSRCYRLLSRRPLAMPGAGTPRLGLHVGTELLVPDLPRPSPHSSTMLAVGAAAQQACLYRVVEY